MGKLVYNPPPKPAEGTFDLIGVTVEQARQLDLAIGQTRPEATPDLAKLYTALGDRLRELGVFA